MSWNRGSCPEGLTWAGVCSQYAAVPLPGNKKPRPGRQILPTGPPRQPRVLVVTALLVQRYEYLDRSGP